MAHSARSLILICLVSVCLSQTASAGITLNTFTTVPGGGSGPEGGSIGFAYAGNKFVGTTYNGTIYSTDLNGGNVQTFGPAGTISGGSVEHFIAGAAGYGGFGRDLYVSQNDANGNGGIKVISNDGSTAGWFSQGLAGNVRGIAFDTIGTFNYDMLVTTNAGNVYQIDHLGHASLIANTGEDTEGLDIAPIGALGIYAGSLLVASEGSGWIRAINPSTHAITNLFQIGGAEELSVVPLNLGVSGNPVEGFYGANFTPNVQKADASQFAGLQGQIVVTSETGHHLYTVALNGSNFNATDQGSFPDQPEDGLFVTAAQIHNTPEPATLASAILGTVGTLVLARRRRKA